MPLPVMTPDEENIIVQSLGGKPGQRLKELPDGNIGIDDGGMQMTAGQGPMPAAPFGQGAMEAAANRGMFNDPRVQAATMGAREAVIPTGVGAGVGHMAGNALRAFGVENPIAAIGIPFVAGLGATVAATKAQDMMRSQQEAEMRNALLADPVNQRMHAVGGLVGSLPFMRPGIAPLQGTARVARNIIAGVAPVAEDVGAAVGTGLGLAANLGPAGYHALTSTNKTDLPSLAISTVGGLLLNQPNTLLGRATGGKIFPDKAYEYTPTPGASMMRGGLEAQMPLEMPETVTKQGMSPEDVKLAAEIAKGREAEIARRFEADKQAEKAAAEVAKEAQRREKQQMAEVVRQAKEEQKRQDEMAKARDAFEKAKKKQAADDVKMAKQQFAMEKKLAAGEIPAEMLAGDTVLTREANMASEARATTPREAAEIAGDESSLAAEKIGQYGALKETPRIPHVPDTYETVKTQMDLALDPASGRKAVLFGKGQETPPIPVRLRRVTTPHGDVVYNPAKISAEEVLAAGSGQEFDARVLGMSQQTKPGEAAGVLVSGKNNAQAEVVSAEGVPAAVEAALKADESAAPELRDAETVIEDRQTQPGLSSEDVSLLSNEENTAADYDTRARETAGDAENIPRIQGMTARTLEGQGYGVDVMNTEGLYNTPDDPRPRWGKQEKNNVEFSTARADTPLHEAMHAMVGQLSDKARGRLQDIVESDPAYAKAKEKNPSLPWEEHLVAEGGQQLLERVQNSEFGLWNDMVSGWKRLTGSATTGDAARKLGNMLARGGGRKGGRVEIHTPGVRTEERTPVGGEAFPGGPTYRRYPEQESFDDGVAPKEEGSKKDNSGAKYSAPEEGVFSTDLEKQARKGGAIWGVMPDKAGGYDATQLIAKFKAQNKIEKEILPGFEEWARGKGKVTAAEVAAYAKDNDPRAKVASYGMDREQSAAKKEYDKLTHDWIENLSTEKAWERSAAFEDGWDTHNSRIVPDKVANNLRKFGWNDEEIAKALRYNELADQLTHEPADVGGPTATHYYNPISPRPVDRPMPDWTATKGKRNLQRVDVVIPRRNIEEWIKPGQASYRIRGSDRELIMPPLSNEEYQQQKASGAWKAFDVDAGKWVTVPHDADLVESTISESHVENYLDKQTKWKQDNLHENLPNTIGWATIQYETGPNGEKIAHVIEVQSKWGQEKRTYEKAYEAALKKQMDKYPHITEADPRIATLKRNAHNEVYSEVRQYRPGMDHPLLADYNRLILKAVIEQARKEGATHIAISDAETAMMTEMHDQSASTRISQEEADALMARRDSGELTPQQYAREVQAAHARSGVRVIDQEPGMRFNYDGRKGQLHKIAQEITRSPGEDVSFGEHKNAKARNSGLNQDDARWQVVDNQGLAGAYSGTQEAAERLLTTLQRERPERGPWQIRDGLEDWHREGKYREDLIFRNPDGTPKTTATGRLYPIAEPAGRRATGEPFTYGGARYSAPDSITGFSTVQKISNPQLRKAVMNAFDEKQRFSGEFANRVVDALRPVRKVLTPEFYDKMVRAYRGQPVSFTFEQQRARRIINTEMTRTASRANKLGATRVIEAKSDYVPEPISEEAIREIKNDRASVASKAIEKQLAAHFSDSALAAEYLNQIAKADYAPDHEYGPLRKAAGRGLPKGVTAGGKYIPIREPDMMVAFERYGNRVARDLAWTREVTAKGMDEKWFDENADKFARLAQHEFNGNVRADYSAWVHEGMRFANALTLGATTAIGNALQLPTVVVRYGGRNAFGAMLKAGARFATDFGRLRNEAVNTGHIRLSQPVGAFDIRRYGSVALDGLRHITDALQVVAARPSEFAFRIHSRAFGEVAAEIAIAEKNTKLIEQVGLDMKDPELKTKLAQRLAIRIEGTYDGRTLPTYLLKGTFGDVMSLAKWNIEHANAWVTDILVPAKNGNPLPLVYTLAAAAGITIPARLAFNEWSRKRKSDPTLKEIKAAEHVLEKDTGKPTTLVGKRTAWLTGMMNTAGILGFLGQGLNVAAQGLSGNRQGTDLFMVPLVEQFGNNIPKLLGDWKEAVDAGTPVEDATKALGVELLKNISQGFRMAYNQLPERQGELAQAAANRDRAVFENLTEDKAAQSVEANKLMNPKVQKFKDSVDVGESAKMLQEITADIEERFKGNPFLMRKKLMALRQLNAREIPNDQWAAGRYRDFLEETLGKAGAEKRMAEWAQRHQANKMKSDMMKGLPEPVPVLK